MEHKRIHRPEIKLAGIRERTNLMTELNPLLGKIGPTVQKYFMESVADRLPHRKNPGTTYCVYTEYESDYQGDYTYFIGEELSSFEDVPDNLSVVVIPAQDYLVYTTPEGPMPHVCIQAWQHIWQLEQEKKLGGNRAYLADFEVYDARAKDPLMTSLDLYVGIKK